MRVFCGWCVRLAMGPAVRFVLDRIREPGRPQSRAAGPADRARHVTASPPRRDYADAWRRRPAIAPPAERNREPERQLRLPGDVR